MSRWWMCALLVLAVGCGKKGPPLPPLTRIPSPPSEVSVLRRGGAVTVQLRVPTTNIDRASPGNIAQVDVYAFDGPPATAADVVIRNGQRVGRVIVNKPIDSDASPDEVDRIRAAQPKEAVDQGAVARIVDTLTTVTPTDAGRVRSYVAVAVNDRGRRGPASPVSVAPLGEAIAAPPAPTVTYSESAITIAWTNENADENAGADAGANSSSATYFVSRIDGEEKPLTLQGTSDASVTDASVVWGERRCYVLRTQAMVDGLPLQSEPSPATCVTLVDTFPPPAPKGLQTIASDGAVSLIWDPSDAPDLAGYLVFRAMAPATEATAVTPDPITDTTFRDSVPAGVHVTYTVVAVDRAGNRSAPSTPAEETAR